MTSWARAGIRATTDEARAQDSARSAKRNKTRAAHSSAVEEARLKWSRGLLRPYLITMALDLAGQEGPQVDAACLAAEPDVDNWEAGTLYPSFPQLLALAALTEFPPHFFTSSTRLPPIPWWETTMRFHRKAQPDLLEATGPVLTFTDDAIRAAGLVYP